MRPTHCNGCKVTDGSIKLHFFKPSVVCLCVAQIFKTRNELYSHVDRSLKHRDERGDGNSEGIIHGFHFRCKRALSSNPKMSFEEFYSTMCDTFSKEDLSRIERRGDRVGGVFDF